MEDAIVLLYRLFVYMSKAPDIPLVLDVLIDHPCNAHGHDSVIPRGDEHQSQTHAHAQEGQGPVGETCSRTCENRTNSLFTKRTINVNMKA